MSEELYRQVVAITEEYLGPATERFLTRQISFHLSKTPTELSREDLPKLIEWTQVTLGLLTEERSLVEEYASRMTQLLEQAPHLNHSH